MKGNLSTLSFALAVTLSMANTRSFAQSKKASGVAPEAPVPASVAAFLKVPGDFTSGDEFTCIALEELWKTYPLGGGEHEALLKYVEKGPDGPGLGFAGLALISFHNPRDVEVILKRALDRKLSAATRWHFLHSAPYVLAIGDVWLDGEGDLDREAREFGRELSQSASLAASLGLGRWHAGTLRELHDLPKKKKESNPDYGLLIWHQSAYLLGTLDLRDQKVLEPLFDPNLGGVFPNLMQALSHASARDFEVELRSKEGPTLEQVRRAAATAKTWWKDYLEKHPDGDWRPAALTGLAEAGFLTESDLQI